LEPLPAEPYALRRRLIPIGAVHEIEGLLLERQGSLIIDVLNGGIWRLDAGRRARRLLGRRVRITGTRDEFDLLAVKTI